MPEEHARGCGLCFGPLVWFEKCPTPGDHEERPLAERQPLQDYQRLENVCNSRVRGDSGACHLTLYVGKHRLAAGVILIQRESAPVSLAVSTNGDLFLKLRGANPGRSLAIPIGPNETMPTLPTEGIEPGAEPSVVPGSITINREYVIPSDDPAEYAYLSVNAQRNLYRVTVP